MISLCTVQNTQEGAAEHSWEKTVGREDVEMHGKEIISEEKKERKMSKPKKVK